ncbi:ferritin-like domain-containing protein [Micromonospora sp. DR5-3]|uniref:ferritin-like fold-containing protein n=1 Tax=unclassified Micromonospora TaxID=2617518 RepID=UPI0011D70FA7|nr:MULTISPECIES: ferritin-like fold-containing protein [unclassified Micromonospora]MCW3812847.1 ferritin-like domain-containing protein [Micromonospora sp. DR5-3]TYC26142.1 hydroxylase [Micromonospora sp. MP36]
MSAPDPALVDLLGLVAYGELLAFDRLAADARLAPDLPRRAALSEMAAAEIAHYRWIADRITALGVRPDEAMAPYVEALQAYHDSTEPKDWLEAVTKAYVGDGISDDFLREIAHGLDGPDRQLVLDVLHDSRYAEFAAAEIRAAIEADPRVANRLSMWARRLVGEALSQAGRVAAADRGALTVLIARREAVDVPALFRQLTDAHTARMTAAGLNN